MINFKKKKNPTNLSIIGRMHTIDIGVGEGRWGRVGFDKSSLSFNGTCKLLLFNI